MISRLLFNSEAWLFIIIALYCWIQAFRDYRSGNYLMLVFGIICILIVLFAPTHSYPVKQDVISDH